MSSLRSLSISARSESRCELTDTYSPAAIDKAPATRPARPATRIVLRVAADAATPIIRLAVDRIPSSAPSTAARNQPVRSLRCSSRCARRDRDEVEVTVNDGTLSRSVDSASFRRVVSMTIWFPGGGQRCSSATVCSKWGFSYWKPRESPVPLRPSKQKRPGPYVQGKRRVDHATRGRCNIGGPNE